MEETPPVLTLPLSIRRAIDAQARRDYPEETCGFLLGRVHAAGCRVVRLMEAPNQDTRNPLRFYEIDRAGYERAEAEAAESGLQLLGIFHSHPDSPPIPSATDAAFAFPEWFYWITPVHSGVPGEPRVWFRTWNPEAWTECDCSIVEEAN